MLEEERSLVKRDPNITGFDLILDDQAMLLVIQQHFPQLNVTSVQKHYLRYKQTTNCLARYHITTNSTRQELYVKAFTKKDDFKLTKALLLQQQERRHDDLNFNQKDYFQRYVLVEHKLIFYGFPYDDKLKALPRLIKDASRQVLLERVLKHEGSLENTHITPLQYKPERRFVAKLTQPSGEHFLIKLHTAHRYQLASQAQQLKMDEKRLLTITGRSSKHHILMYRWIEGDNLTDSYHGEGFDLEHIRSTGQYLARFHRSKKKRLNTRNNDEFTHVLTQLGEGISHLLPALKPRIKALLPSLTTAINSLHSKLRRIHGDFYSKQVLLTRKGIQFIDFDDVCIWYPAYDLGLFIAHLERDALSGIITHGLANQITQSLLEGYAEIHPYSKKEVELFIAVGLLQLAHHPFRNANPQWPSVISLIISCCQDHLKQYLNVSAPLSSPPIVIAGESCPKQLQELSYMAAPLIKMLSPILAKGEIANLESIHLIRHKKGKRCLLEYMFTISKGDIKNELSILGKGRIKGFDKRAWSINTQLYEAGFNEQSGDKIQVPEPLGYNESLHIWFQRKVAGETLFYPFSNKEEGLILANKVAEALYKLHSSSINIDKHHTIDKELSLLWGYLSKVMETHNEWKEDIKELLLRCRLLSELLPPSAPCVIHRDFYQDQLIVQRESLFILDLDLCCLGDPAVDIGNFIAHIQEQCLRDFGDLNYANKSLSELTRSYQELSKKQTAPSIEIYTLLSWTRHIYISQRIAERQPFTKAIIVHCLSLSEDILNKYTSKVSR
ncbi:phosphotransferase [Vibrio sp. ZSDE26]|uniref:Phosphotransferase n=1 Tax=Vibrio amylolyticus TaxID=2847292 RepID=A0A9X1XI97_9VIBR|nr:phosphotransferase [Vibrio amylolyticus]MCK6262123.1 phosphotransferase [Vibrio amylolyticus]